MICKVPTRAAAASMHMHNLDGGQRVYTYNAGLEGLQHHLVRGRDVDLSAECHPRAEGQLGDEQACTG